MWAIIMLIMVGKTQGQVNVWFGNIDTVLCPGQTASIIVDAIGEQPFTYLWNTTPPQTTDFINNVSAGTYTVTVTDNNGNTGTASITIYQDSLSATVSHIDSISCYALNTNTGSITIAVNGGIPPIYYFWDTEPPQTTQNAINLPAGLYMVHINDQHCDTFLWAIVSQPTPPIKQICYAGFDTITLKNNIYFPINLTANIDSFHVYKEVSLNVWNLIGSVAANINYFTDTNSNPAAQSYSYKIAVIDTCGNEGTKSNAHSTITLFASYDYGTDTYGFSWSAYAGLTVSDYYLYGVTAGGANVQIGSVPGNQYLYNYVNPN